MRVEAFRSRDDITMMISKSSFIYLGNIRATSIDTGYC